MHIQRSARHLFTAPVLICGLGLVLAACGSSGGGSSSPSSSPTATSPTSSPAATSSGPASGAAAEIEKNWTTFFSAHTPVAKRVALLQNGTQFASVIKAQENSPLTSSVTAKVSSVTVQSATMAKVIYSILLAGQPALSNQNGVAIKQGGAWKVGDASFCGLLAVQNSGNTSKLPAACRSAG